MGESQHHDRRAERSRTYIAIDLKSFYASVECVERGLDPLTTNLVVADVERTEKTICLAVSPSLKAYGIGGRARLFEVVERMKQVNESRRLAAPGHRLVGESCDSRDLRAQPRLKSAYIAAKPRMSHYLSVSAQIYGIYLRYAAADDIHVYSIDEVFIDATRYLNAWHGSAHAMARAIVRDIMSQTGITATAGIGTNLYLCKVAMDIVAKHIPADGDGVRIAELDEASYRRLLWDHRPLTDFWRVGRGYAKKLESHGIMTMGDVARCSIGRASDYYNEELLYRLFGVNAELLIDHAWGWEPCTIAEIKDYRPDGHSMSNGQVLTAPADYATARLIAREMADALALDLVAKRLKANRLTVVVGYDVGSLDPARLDACASAELRRAAVHAAKVYTGPVSTDYYGRRVPKSAHGAVGFGAYTSSGTMFRKAAMAICDQAVNPILLVRRIVVIADGLVSADSVGADDIGGVDSGPVSACSDHEGIPEAYEQPDLFEQSLFEQIESEGRTSSSKGSEPSARNESQMQQALLDVKRRFGKNAVFRGMNMEQGATGRIRNNQIGGHAA